MLSTSNSIAQRVIPQTRWFQVGAEENALVIRENQPMHTLSSGRHKVKGIFQPRPELYTFPTRPFPLFLWITGLYSADGSAINLSWKLDVRVVDPEKLWRNWLQFQESDEITGPDAVVAARIADAVQEIVGRYGLEELRTDPDTRRQVGGKVGLLVKDELACYGLEIARQLDYEHLRFQSAADIAAAQVERETLTRMVEDAKLQTLINRMDNAETLAYRLREWLDKDQGDISDQTLAEVVEQAVGGNTDVLSQILQERTESTETMQDQAMLSPVDLSTDEIHTGPFHFFHHIGQFVLVAGLVAALVLAAILTFEPGMLIENGQRNMIVGIVVGVALGGLIVAWILDQLIRWQARRAAWRMLADARLDPQREDIGKVELRHMLMLMGAFLAVLAAGIALWLPDYYPWVRFGGAVITLLAAAIAIRYDWIRSIEQAMSTMNDARRRVAGSRLSMAQRTRIHEQRRADLAAEAQVAVDHLEEAKQTSFRELRDRSLYTRIKRSQERLRTMLPQVKDLQQANAMTQEADPERVERQTEAMQEEIQRCSELAQAILWHVQQKQPDVIQERLDELEQSIQEMQALLTRWQAMTV